MNNNTFDIAIIGLAGRFPQASDLESFWEMLKNGNEAIINLSDDELLAAGVDPKLLKHPDYVKTGTHMTGIENFDANFFNVNNRDAENTDPQHRIFLECAWQALEQAGYPPETTKDRIGLYAGMSDATYMQHHLEPIMSELETTVGRYRLSIINDKDFIATRTAYKLNLKGPAMGIQTACSTSLVTVHVACQSLLNMECDMALAGGSSIRLPQKKGYLYQEGMISSPDGHCRAFDAQSKGTVSGNGIGVVVLKRMEDALADGDTIHAVIRGSAINNDGSDKIGYTAPSVNGQTNVILEALSVAGVHPDEISYVEAHGTGTPLGDPIEIEALTKAFRTETDRKGFCAVGSVKTNIGHADTAAGIAGLIKTVLALKNRQIPASLHYENPNPQINFADSPFFVNNKLKEWETKKGTLRCAGVSSFGVGGTNAHVIVAEAPPIEQGSSSRDLQLISLSAKTATALETSKSNLANFLQSNTDISLPDVAFTLNRGRQSFEHRSILVCSDSEDAVQQLKSPNSLAAYQTTEKNSEVVFLFPGQGSQYLNMTKELYDKESVFRNTLNNCAELLTPYLQEDIRNIIYSEKEENINKLKQTVFTQSALFAVEYSLAKLWISWGIRPKAMLGHSIGEYVAACLAGVFSLEDALSLVAERGKLIQSLPSGAMLAVPLSENEVKPWLSPELSLSVVNSAERCIIGGTHEAIKTLQNKLLEQGTACTLLQTSHAFHSRMMEPILAPFTKKLQEINLNKPSIPFLSNCTGLWANPEEVTSPEYWVKHLRYTVRFADALNTLFHQDTNILLEIGPGQTLSSLARRHPQFSDKYTVLNSMPRNNKTANNAETNQILLTLGQLWANNIEVNWEAFYSEEKRHRIPLPTYPFERKRYWVDSPQERKIKNNEKDWLYQPVWMKKPMPNVNLKNSSKHWLIFNDEHGIGQKTSNWLKQLGNTVIMVNIGTSFENKNADMYSINPQNPTDYESLVKALTQNDFPSQVVHCWCVSDVEQRSTFERNDLALQNGFYSLLNFIKAMSNANINSPLDISIVSNQMQAVLESDKVLPEKASILGAVKTIGKEFNNINCRSIDIELSSIDENISKLLGPELISPVEEQVIAYRSGQAWIQTYKPLQWRASASVNRFRQYGVYLITGGLGGIGLALAEYLTENFKAKLVLVGRSTFPKKANWQEYLNDHNTDNSITQKIRSLQTLEEKGAEVLVYSADIADLMQMEQLIESAQQQFGKLNGVIHSAGVADGALIANRDFETSAKVLAPKIQGTLVLDKLLSENHLDFFILCSSISSVSGAGGQIAYCAANAFQDAFAHANRNHPQTLYSAINWDTWQKVGMAVDSVRKSLAIARERKVETTATKIKHPLFDSYKIEENQIHYISHLNDKQWILNDHRIFGKDSAVMPGTAYLEWARSALIHHLLSTNEFAPTVHLKEVYFLKPVIVENNKAKTLYTTLKAVDSGFEFIISSQTENGNKQEHTRGFIEAGTSISLQKYSIKNIRNRCQKRKLFASSDLAIKPSVERNDLENVLNIFGVHWHNLRKIYFGENEGLAYLELPTKFIESLNEYPLHPGLMDMATGFFGMMYKEGTKASLPFLYESIKVYKPLTSRFYSYARIQNPENYNPDSPIIDITILDEQETILVEIIGYTSREVKKNTLTHNQMQQKSSSSQNLLKNQDEITLEQRLSHGLLPNEGVKAFEQILKHNKPQVLVSKQGLETLLEKTSSLLDSPKVTIQNQGKSQRPALAQSYLTPNTELEKKIAEVWERFLGIEPIGIEDDFFDLGGDSLLAIQLTSYLRKELQIDLATQALLNTPSISGLIKLLQADSSTSESSEQELLIKIKTGSLPPLMVIHPVGGNVVHYRKFAKHLDTEQAVYAIRAMGLDGKTSPLATIEEMAAHYIKCIKKHQANGPYLIGGYSMGGTIAWEMVQQLTKQGDEISLLVMIDPGWPDSITKYGTNDEINIMADMFELSKGVAMSRDELLNMYEQDRWKWFVEKMEGDSTETSQERTRNFMEVFRVNTNALSDYRAQEWDGKVIFFRAKEQTDYSVIPEDKWAKIMQNGIDLHYIPGNHVSMMNDDSNVQGLSEILQKAIYKANKTDEKLLTNNTYSNEILS